MTGAVVYGASTAFNAYSQYRAGKAQQQIDEFNARIAEYEAVDALRRGEEDAYKFGEQVRRLMGTQKAGFAGQGVVVSEGSAADVIADTARQGELDRLTILNNAAKEAWGFRTQGTGYRAQGRLSRLRGEYGAVGTILGGAYTAYDRFNRR